MSVRRPAPSVSVLVAEHLLAGAALLLRGGRLTLDGLARLLALVLELCSLLWEVHHWGHLAALRHGHRPPGQSGALQLMVHGVDQGGDVDEVGHRLRFRPSDGADALWDHVGRAVVDHGGAADCVEGDGEDGVVQGERSLAGRQVTHGYGLQAGELGGGVAGDGRDGDVGQPHGAVWRGGRGSTGVGKDNHLMHRERGKIFFFVTVIFKRGKKTTACQSTVRSVVNIDFVLTDIQYPDIVQLLIYNTDINSHRYMQV